MNGDGTGLSNRVLLIASVVFILVVGAIFFLITNGGSRTSQREVGPSVTDMRIGRSVKMTVAGPIVGNEARNSYSIEVSQDERVVTRMQGYQAEIVEERTYENNRKAYEEFVYALERARFGNARNVSDSAEEERGACATGKRYIFEIQDNGNQIQRLWTTSCDGAKGTLNANSSSLKTLFDKQIPELSQVLKGARL